MSLQKQSFEDWEISASDALRVSLFSPDQSRENEVENRRVSELQVVQADSASRPDTLSGLGKYSVSDTNPYSVRFAPGYDQPTITLKSQKGDDDEILVNEAPPVGTDQIPNNHSSQARVIIYTPLDSHFQLLEKVVLDQNADLDCVRYSSDTPLELNSARNPASAMLVYMSDDDESALLDQLLDQHESVSTFFLVDANITSRCITKISDFLKDNRLTA